MIASDNFNGILGRIIKENKVFKEPETQADPTLKSERLYTRLSAAQVRRQLIKQKGYSGMYNLGRPPRLWVGEDS
jgi:hypothetical protein